MRIQPIQQPNPAPIKRTAITQPRHRVKIRVENGVAYVAFCPPGVEVEVVDYDVEPEASDRDAAGVPCASYVVAN